MWLGWFTISLVLVLSFGWDLWEKHIERRR